MKDTTGIEDTIRRVVSAAVEREVAEGPAGEATVALRRGARSVELRETGGGWLVAWHGCTAEPGSGGGKLVPSLVEALDLAVRMLDAEREEEQKAGNGVGLRNAALSSSVTACPDPSGITPPAAPRTRRQMPPGPERGRGGRSL